MTELIAIRSVSGSRDTVTAANAIVARLRAAGFKRVASFRFPIEINATTRLALQRSAAFEPDSVAVLMRATARQPIDAAAAGRLTARPATLSPPSPLTPRLLKSIETTATRFWPGVVVVPVMSSGATDGSAVRNAGIPVYGAGGIFTEPGDSHAHGRDERVEALSKR